MVEPVKPDPNKINGFIQPKTKNKKKKIQKPKNEILNQKKNRSQKLS